MAYAGSMGLLGSSATGAILERSSCALAQAGESAPMALLFRKLDLYRSLLPRAVLKY
ncbi:MAG: hypothetical protein GXP27_19705 [Planctomycetes bacterium]|nr:hypothetical protein [Planctomycetota bacterium]